MKISLKYDEYLVTVFANIVKDKDTGKFRVADYIFGDIRNRSFPGNTVISELERRDFIDQIMLDDELFRSKILNARETEIKKLRRYQREDDRGMI